jgi:hypothetical protein
MRNFAEDPRLFQAQILVRRLERLSADSTWAHRASGIRASLDKFLAEMNPTGKYDAHKLSQLVALGFEIIEKAAQEIPTPDDILFGSKTANKPE